MQHRLRFAPEILARLGEELVPHPDLGVLELVRNAYDADAATCRIELADALAPGGSLVVIDDGDGMTGEQLSSGFLLIGKSGKSHKTHTPSGRRKVGEKGLGRLTALRLGREVTVRTRPRSEPGVEYCLSIDWKLVDNSAAVEDVPLTISRRTTPEPHGTTVSVTALRQGFADSDAERLARSLLLLTGPFPDGSAFHVMCDAPEFAALADQMRLYRRFEDQYEYKLVAHLDEKGKARATLYNWRGEPEFTGDHGDVALRRTRGKRNDIPLAFYAPAVTFEVWMFNLNPGASKEIRHAQLDIEKLRDWLKVVGGIHLYHRQLRVQPYGDTGNDWLGINLRRVGSPELRPSTNNSLGRISVEDPGEKLRPKTDRSGFIDNTEFAELQEFAKRALDWSAHIREEQRDQRKVGAGARARDKSAEAEEKLNQLLEVVQADEPQTPTLIDPSDPALVGAIASAATDAVATKKEEIRTLREDLRLYRSLASVGTSTAVFAHEALRPAARIITELKTVRKRILKRLDEAVYEDQFRPAIDSSVDGAKTVHTFAKLPLGLLEKGKRDVADIEVDTACRTIAHLFSLYMQERNIEVVFDLGCPGSTVHTTIADIESIVSNLLANAAHAFTRGDAPARRRVVRIRTRPVDETIAVCVDDSGPGIAGLPIKEVWKPGRTTRDNGTGLGLTIVRDIVADLKGRKEARVQGELGGARIMIWLPATHPVGVDYSSGGTG